MFRGPYQPRKTIDGAANFLGLKAREGVLEVSQQLSIPYIPKLLQFLPAKKPDELRKSQEYKGYTGKNRERNVYEVTQEAKTAARVSLKLDNSN
jgi:hypothetical protein